MPLPTAQEVLDKIKRGEEMNVKDFEALHLPFEGFLKYSQLSDKGVEKFHQNVIDHYKDKV